MFIERMIFCAKIHNRLSKSKELRCYHQTNPIFTILTRPVNPTTCLIPSHNAHTLKLNRKWERKKCQNKRTWLFPHLIKLRTGNQTALIPPKGSDINPNRMQKSREENGGEGRGSKIIRLIFIGPRARKNERMRLEHLLIKMKQMLPYWAMPYFEIFSSLVELGEIYPF